MASRLSTVGNRWQCRLVAKATTKIHLQQQNATCIFTSLDAVLTSLHAHSPPQNPCKPCRWTNNPGQACLPMSQPVRCDCSGGAAPVSSAPAVGSELVSEYGSDEEVGQASVQGSAATAAEARDSGAQSANGLPSNFFEVGLFVTQEELPCCITSLIISCFCPILSLQLQP